MQIVIDVPDEEYNRIQSLEWKDFIRRGSEIARTIRAIHNGIPLPKGHGRLKDIDAFLGKVRDDRKHACYMRSWTADDVLNSLDHDYAPTIIPADKESDNGNSN